MNRELWEELERVSAEETQNNLLENLSNSDFQKFFDKYFLPYRDVFERLA